MNTKKTIKISLIIILVLAECYLIFAFVTQNVDEKRKIQNYCDQNCIYNPVSYYWEVSGQDKTKGFTTKEECFSYCSRLQRGFASLLNRYFSDFTAALFNKNK